MPPDFPPSQLTSSNFSVVRCIPLRPVGTPRHRRAAPPKPRAAQQHRRAIDASSRLPQFPIKPPSAASVTERLLGSGALSSEVISQSFSSDSAVDITTVDPTKFVFDLIPPMDASLGKVGSAVGPNECWQFKDEGPRSGEMVFCSVRTPSLCVQDRPVPCKTAPSIHYILNYIMSSIICLRPEQIFIGEPFLERAPEVLTPWS